MLKNTISFCHSRQFVSIEHMSVVFRRILATVEPPCHEYPQFVGLLFLSKLSLILSFFFLKRHFNLKMITFFLYVKGMAHHTANM